jgi:hypothetical protein
MDAAEMTDVSAFPQKDAGLLVISQSGETKGRGWDGKMMNK